MTTQSSLGGHEGRGDGRGERTDRRGDEHDRRLRDGRGDALRASVDRAELERPLEHRAVRVIPAHLGPRPSPRRQADRTTDQPDAEDRELQGACPAWQRIRRR